MSFLRNIQKVVPSRLLNKPNTFLYPVDQNPTYLCQQVEPNIQYLHSYDALIKTIRELKNLKETTGATYTSRIDTELEYLEKAQISYNNFVIDYVELCGVLTGQSIATLYKNAQQLNLTAKWLETWVLEQVATKVKYMSQQNLRDTLEGLQKYHQGHTYISLIEKQIASKNTGEVQYVEPYIHDVHAFQYSQKQLSNHALIRAIQQRKNVQIITISDYIKKASDLVYELLSIRPRYNLHSQ